MQSQTGYNCNRCHKLWNTEKEAVKCQEGHPVVDSMKIDNVIYTTHYEDGYDDVPELINVKIGDRLFRYIYRDRYR